MSEDYLERLKEFVEDLSALITEVEERRALDEEEVVLSPAAQAFSDRMGGLFNKAYKK